MIIDNRGGGNGKIGAEAVSKANPDGYTLLFGETGMMAINVWLMDRAGSHPVKDFVALGQVVTLDNALVAHPSAGVKNLRELVAKAAQKRGVALELHYRLLSVENGRNIG